MLGYLNPNAVFSLLGNFIEFFFYCFYSGTGYFLCNSAPVNFTDILPHTSNQSRVGATQCWVVCAKPVKTAYICQQ